MNAARVALASLVSIELASLVPILLAAGCGLDPGAPLELDGDAGAGLEIPVGTALQPWLADRSYQGFAAESAVHRSTGAHPRVRTFLSPGLAASFAAGAATHPRGAGAVKELYDGDRLRGWAVEVKVRDDSAGGDGWYWYEVSGTGADADADVHGTGADDCTSCHDAGRDYVRTPFPLR